MASSANYRKNNNQLAKNEDLYFVVKTGSDIMISNKTFVITKNYPCTGQFLTSMWFNPRIKSDAYKQNIWLAILKVPKSASIEERHSIKKQLNTTNPEDWHNLACFAYISKYRREMFFGDITDGSKYLAEKSNDSYKQISVCLPCRMKGDSNRLSFKLSMTYQKQMEGEQYTENDLFRNNEQKDSDVLVVSLNCPSFTLKQ